MTGPVANATVGTRLAGCLLLLISATGVGVEELDPVEKQIVTAVEAGQQDAIALLAETVNIASATENHAGVRRVGDVYARELRALGFQTRWIELPAKLNRAGHLLAVHNGGNTRRILLIGHLDTVLEAEPFRRDDNRAYGSGSSDMKGGNAIIVAALRALKDVGALVDRNITVVFTGDEEDPGDPALESREALMQAGLQSDIALGFEGGVPGLAVIGRRGIAVWRLQVAGRQGHSSGIFREEMGDGAIFEASRILQRFHQELREPNLTYNPSLIVGGTNVTLDEGARQGSAEGKTNVIPRVVLVEGDLRYLSAEQYESARQRMSAIVEDSLPGTSSAMKISEEYPAMAPTQSNRQLLRVLDRASLDLGLGPIVAQDPAERGAGDISFVCNGRLACLDGLGAFGGKDHAPGEYVEIDTLAMLTKRTALLIHRLSR
jgi:glutamate carboxypeptidase